MKQINRQEVSEVFMTNQAEKNGSISQSRSVSDNTDMIFTEMKKSPNICGIVLIEFIIGSLTISAEMTIHTARSMNASTLMIFQSGESGIREAAL